jgi:hypothetical protein
MKIRNGFVSNSSSSSFVIISRLEDHNEALKQLKPMQRKMIENAIAKKPVGGEILCMLAVYYDSEAGSHCSETYFCDTLGTGKNPEDMSDEEARIDEPKNGYQSFEDEFPLTDAVDAYRILVLKHKDRDSIEVNFQH